MIDWIVLIIALILLVPAFYPSSDSEFRRSQAEAEIQLYAARRSREAEELKWAICSDCQRARYEFDAALREIEE